MKSRLAKIFSLVPFCIMLFAPISDDGKSVIVKFNNGEKQIIAMEEI